ncbi:MAG: spore maturation protein [Bacillota bacterium]|nr:spore maturation protein [Bacillota bacterium]
MNPYIARGVDPVVNSVWLSLIAAGVITGLLTGTSEAVTRAALESAGSAVTLCFGLIGAMALWCGVMKVAEEAGIARWLARMVAPAARLLFPSVPARHPAIAAVAMSITANLLGMGNAATPLGIKAMEELAALAGDREEASDAMCTFVAICTAGITLVPTTIIAIRAQFGSGSPAEVVAPIILVNLLATTVALIADRFFRPISRTR